MDTDSIVNAFSIFYIMLYKNWFMFYVRPSSYG